jgi:hypothetical protein
VRRLWLALLPWLIFDTSLRNAGISVVWGGGFALGMTVAMMAAERRARPQLIEGTALFLFASLILVAEVLGLAADVRPWSRAISSAALAAVMLASCVRRPFTVPYLRLVTPERAWAGPEFRRVNAKMSGVFAATVLAVALLQGFAAHFTSPLEATILNWIVPIVFLVVLGLWCDGLLARHLDGDEPLASDLAFTLEQIGELEASEKVSTSSGRPQLRLFKGGDSVRS